MTSKSGHETFRVAGHEVAMLSFSLRQLNASKTAYFRHLIRQDFYQRIAEWLNDPSVTPEFLENVFSAAVNRAGEPSGRAWAEWLDKAIRMIETEPDTAAETKKHRRDVTMHLINSPMHFKSGWVGEE